jgi:hypothetical protein
MFLCVSVPSVIRATCVYRGRSYLRALCGKNIVPTPDLSHTTAYDILNPIWKAVTGSSTRNHRDQPVGARLKRAELAREVPGC